METLRTDESVIGEVRALPDYSAASHSVFFTGWGVEPQSDDRPVMSGKVPPSTAPRSVQRSTARRIHQAMFKEWSQSRHD